MKPVCNFSETEFVIYEQLFDFFNFMGKEEILDGYSFNFREDIGKKRVTMVEFLAQVFRKVYLELVVIIMNQFNDDCFFD